MTTPVAKICAANLCPEAYGESLTPMLAGPWIDGLEGASSCGATALASTDAASAACRAAR